MRPGSLDPSRLLDAMLQLGPVPEAVFPGDDELRIRKGQRLLQHRLWRPSIRFRMMRGDPSCRGTVALAMRSAQFVRLNLQLVEARTWRESPGRHACSFREVPDVRGTGRKKRDSSTTT